MERYYLPVSSKLWMSQTASEVARYTPVAVKKSAHGTTLHPVTAQDLKNGTFRQLPGYAVSRRTLLVAQTGGLFGIDWNPADSPYWSTIAPFIPGSGLIQGAGAAIDKIPNPQSNAPAPGPQSRQAAPPPSWIPGVPNEVTFLAGLGVGTAYLLKG